MEGNINPADWVTKPRKAEELGENSFWQKGPQFLTQNVEKWPVKYDFYLDDPSLKEGDLVQGKKGSTCFCFFTTDKVAFLNDLMKKFNDAEKLVNVICRLLKWKSIGVFPLRKMISVEERKYAETRVIKLVQQNHGKDLEDSC